VRQEWARNNPERKECFAQAKVIPFQTKDLPKWLCAHFDGTFALSDVQCDHIEPISNTTPQTLEEFIECVKKLHVSVMGLQILCKLCHKVKTKLEAHKRMRLNLIEIISSTIQPSSVLEELDTVVLRKIANAVQGMKGTVNEERKIFEKKFDQLCKKYL